MTGRTNEDLLGPATAESPLNVIARAAETLGEDFGGDTINGFAFASAHAGEFVFVPESKAWLKFEGARWAPGNADQAMQAFAADRMDSALANEERASTEENKAATKAAMKLLHDRSRQQSALASASALDNMRAHVAEFDRDPWWLGVPNGAVDLRSGRLIAPEPQQRISKSAGAAFDPGASCDQWRAFLETVLPDPDVRAFVQRAVGYTLTGLVDEEIIVFMRGVGANGKSVFANVLAALFGDYEMTAGSDLLVKTKHDSQYERERARLPGARLVLINEVAQGDVWDDQKVKQVASREKIPARKLYGEGFDFHPSHCIWIRGNHAPGAHDAGHAFWRRMVPVHFGVKIPARKQIADLDRRIIAHELPGVLNWAVEGCSMWQSGGLRIPSSIETERRAYKASTDIVGQWIEERTERAADARTPIGDAFTSFRDFCHSSGTAPGYVNTFSQSLSERGFGQRGSRRDGRNIGGLRLVSAHASKFEACDD